MLKNKDWPADAVKEDEERDDAKRNGNGYHETNQQQGFWKKSVKSTETGRQSMRAMHVPRRKMHAAFTLLWSALDKYQVLRIRRKSWVGQFLGYLTIRSFFYCSYKKVLQRKGEPNLFRSVNPIHSFFHLPIKNYYNWWKFNKVLTETIVHSFFWDTV